MGEIGRLAFIRRLCILKRVERFNVDALATLCKNLVNFDPVTPEWLRGAMESHHLSISSLTTSGWRRQY